MAIARPLGQHWTFGQQFVQPIIAPPPVPVAKPVFIVPAVALCIIFGVVAIAAAVALSLIPIYTPRRTFNVTCTSEMLPETFNINQDTLPVGALSQNNKAALQNGISQQIASEPGFSQCHVEVPEATVDACPGGQRLSNRKKRSGDGSLKTREIRQANDNCNTQQLTSKVVLNCNCTCIGVCLRRKAQQLNNLLLALTASITFPELGLTGNQIGVIIISGVNVPTNSFTKTTTKPTTSTSSSVSSTTATVPPVTSTTTTSSTPTTTTTTPSTTTTAMVTANFLG